MAFGFWFFVFVFCFVFFTVFLIVFFLREKGPEGVVLDFGFAD